MVSQRLQAKVRREFLDAAAAEAAIRRLSSLNLANADSQSRERIQTGIVLLSNGDSALFEYHAGVAEEDWRDVLAFSGLGEDDWAARLDAELGPGDHFVTS